MTKSTSPVDVSVIDGDTVWVWLRRDPRAPPCGTGTSLGDVGRIGRVLDHAELRIAELSKPCRVQ